MKFSIVINTYNRRPYLENALQSLRYLRHDAFEVVCVNGPSDDGTDELLQKWKNEIKVCSCPETNLSMSRNIGIRNAAGDVICFMDDDAIPEPSWLNALERGYDDIAVSAVGGFIRNHTGVAFQSRFVVCDRYADSLEFNNLADISCGSDQYIAITGTNCSFRRSALTEIGGFDEAYVYFLDETDVLIRLADKGHKIVCLPDAEIHHKYAPSHLRTHNHIAKSLYHPCRSKSYFAFRHALPKDGMLATTQKLQAYFDFVRACQQYQHSTGNMAEEDRIRLEKEISQGYTDGCKKAFEIAAPFVRPPAYFAEPPIFKRFTPKRHHGARMHICFISQDYPPEPNGGIGVFYGLVAEGLASLGHEVTVITKSQGHSTADFYNNVWVHRIAATHHARQDGSGIPPVPDSVYSWSRSACMEIQRLSHLRQFDFVAAPIWDVEGVACHENARVPVVLTLHTSYALALDTKEDWLSSPQYVEQHVMPVIGAEKFLLQNSSYIIANSDAIVDDMEKSYGLRLRGKNLAVIPHGLPDSSVCARVEKKNDAEVNILFVGRLESRKGVDVLFSVLPAILGDRPHVTVTLAGASTGADFTDAFISRHSGADWFGRVAFTGFVDDAKCNDLFASCDIFVAPSRYESFGLIYLQAMMHGKPCVGTTAGGIPEVVQNGVTGFTAIPGDAESLQKSLITLVDDARLRRVMGEAGLRRYREHFTAKRMVRNLERFFKSVPCGRREKTNG